MHAVAGLERVDGRYGPQHADQQRGGDVAAAALRELPAQQRAREHGGRQRELRPGNRAAQDPVDAGDERQREGGQRHDRLVDQQVAAGKAQRQILAQDAARK